MSMPTIRCTLVVLGFIGALALSMQMLPADSVVVDRKMAIPPLPPALGSLDLFGTLVLNVPVCKIVALYLTVVFAHRTVTTEVPFLDPTSLMFYGCGIGLMILDDIEWLTASSEYGYGIFPAAAILITLIGWKIMVRGHSYDGNIVMSGKTVIVTGANTGIGLETAVAIAALGARVIIGCRTKSKAEAALVKINQRVPGSNPIFIPLDISSLESVEAFCHEISARKLPVHVLINNAGCLMTSRKLNNKGVEMMVATNYLGPFLLTKMLLPKLLQNPNSRVVNVSSSTHHYAAKLDFASLLKSDPNNFSTVDVYAKTKLCNIIHASELHRRYGSKGLATYSVHPGTVTTEVARDMGFLGQIWMAFGPVFNVLVKSPTGGAFSTVHAACAPSLNKGTGYILHCQFSTFLNPLARDGALARKLWEWSESNTDMTFR